MKIRMFTLGEAYSFGFNREMTRYGHNLNRLKPIFNNADVSLTTTIRPNTQNTKLISRARGELSQIASSELHSEGGSRGGILPYISVHIRRGDQKAVSWTYHKTYIPVPNYVQAFKDTWTRLVSNAQESSTTSKQIAYVASDSPSTLEEFAQSLTGATIFSLSRSKDPELRKLASPGEYFQSEFSKLEESIRISATRGMIVDFALLSGAWAQVGDLIPDATICTFKLVEKSCFIVLRINR